MQIRQCRNTTPLSDNVEDTVVFLGLKLLISKNSVYFPAVEMRKSLL